MSLPLPQLYVAATVYSIMGSHLTIRIGRVQLADAGVDLHCLAYVGVKPYVNSNNMSMFRQRRYCINVTEDTLPSL